MRRMSLYIQLWTGPAVHALNESRQVTPINTRKRQLRRGTSGSSIHAIQDQAMLHTTYNC